jgi:hypothetical protein
MRFRSQWFSESRPCAVHSLQPGMVVRQGLEDPVLNACIAAINFMEEVRCAASLSERRLRMPASMWSRSVVR